jgi:chemotaxis protein CheX
MNVEYLNPIIKASTFVLQQSCNVTVSVGKPYLTQTTYEEEVFVVLLGITGQLHGQVLLVMDINVARKIASNMMMGMPVNELNDMAKSALGELMNMMMGNAMTYFSQLDILLDITPPTMFVSSELSLSVGNSRMVCIPIKFEDGTIELNVAIKENSK